MPKKIFDILNISGDDYGFIFYRLFVCYDLNKIMMIISPTTLAIIARPNSRIVVNVFFFIGKVYFLSSHHTNKASVKIGK